MTKLSLVLLLSTLFALTSCSSGKMHTNVPLQWRPTTKLTELSRINLDKVLGHKIKIADLKDNRKEPLSRVAENTEDEKIKTVDTSTNVAQFTTDNFKDTLKKSGLDVVDSGEEFTLSGDINELFVRETNDYVGHLILKLQLKKGNKVVWQGMTTGSSTRFGRSYKMENYNETISDSIIDAAMMLLRNDDFQKSFATK